jgi:hypothetical protein
MAEEDSGELKPNSPEVPLYACEEWQVKKVKPSS